MIDWKVRAEQAESSLAAMTKERDESNERIRLIEESGARVWVDEIRKNRDRYMWAESSLAAERSTVAELREERDTFEKVSAGHEVRIVGLLGRIEQLEASCKHETERWQYAESQPNWSNWRNEQLRAEAAKAQVAALSKDLARAREALKDGIGAILLGTSVAYVNVSEVSEPCDHCGQCQRMKARRVMVSALSATEAPSESVPKPCVNCQEPENVHGIGGYYCKEFKTAPDSAAGGKANG